MSNINQGLKIFFDFCNLFFKTPLEKDEKNPEKRKTQNHFPYLKKRKNKNIFYNNKKVKNLKIFYRSFYNK